MNEPLDAQTPSDAQSAFTLVDLSESETLMGAVQAAIDALENGTYGTCLVCGNDLAATLAENPVALTCDTHLALA